MENLTRKTLPVVLEQGSRSKKRYPEQNLFILCINKDFIFVCIDNMITITNHIIHYSTPKTSKTFTNTTKTYKEALEVTKSTASS